MTVTDKDLKFEENILQPKTYNNYITYELERRQILKTHKAGWCSNRALDQHSADLGSNLNRGSCYNTD